MTDDTYRMPADTDDPVELKARIRELQDELGKSEKEPPTERPWWLLDIRKLQTENAPEDDTFVFWMVWFVGSLILGVLSGLHMGVLSEHIGITHAYFLFWAYVVSIFAPSAGLFLYLTKTWRFGTSSGGTGLPTGYSIRRGDYGLRYYCTTEKDRDWLTHSRTFHAAITKCIEHSMEREK